MLCLSDAAFRRPCPGWVGPPECLGSPTPILWYSRWRQVGGSHPRNADKRRSPR